MIGGGVVGVTSALQLLQKGYKVTVVAKEFASPVASGKCITSEIAGALWEWPPAVCGRHTDEKSLERSKVWCMDSYGKFMELAMNPKETGAYLRQSVFYFKDMVEDLPAQLDKMNELCHLPGFRHDSKLIEETGKSSYGALSNVRSFYEYFCLMLIKASPNKSAFISYLLTDFNASYISMLCCCASPLCSHTDF